MNAATWELLETLLGSKTLIYRPSSTNVLQMNLKDDSKQEKACDST